MDYYLLLILAIAVFCGFFVQTLVGFAGSLIALPILLLALKMPDAIAYISLFYLVSSSCMVFREWKNIDRDIILRLSFTSVIGVVLGIMVLTYAKPVVLKKALGIFILLYVAYGIYGRKEYSLGKKTNFAFGVLGGFFSGVFSTGGPLYVISVKNSVQEARIFRATMIGILALVTLIRVPALSISGILNLTHVKMSLFILPVFFLAQFLGTKLFPKINELQFKNILLVLLCLSGIALLL